MKQFSIIPQILSFNSAKEYFAENPVDSQVLIFAGGTVCKILHRYFEKAAYIVDFADLPKGEPTDIIAEQICLKVKDIEYSRVVAIGGGTVLDVAKLFVLEKISPVVDLFLGRFNPIKAKHLTLIPTTCGTGSEVTNISILELTAINSKFGLSSDSLFADEAVLIPELANSLPFESFAASAIDALVHSIESFTSPKANDFTRLFSRNAMTIILEGFSKIAKNGAEARFSFMDKFLTASCFAGIAFGNAGCAAVHAMSYPLGANYHVAHGEANYAMLTAVYKKYLKIKSDGAIAELNKILADILKCKSTDVYKELEVLLNKLIQKQPLHNYGMKVTEIFSFADSVLAKQGRLMANNFVPLQRDDLIDIYTSVY